MSAPTAAAAVVAQTQWAPSTATKRGLLLSWALSITLQTGTNSGKSYSNSAHSFDMWENGRCFPGGQDLQLQHWREALGGVGMIEEGDHIESALLTYVLVPYFPPRLHWPLTRADLGTLRRHCRSLEEAGHDVYWSTQDTHRAICERVIGIPLPIPPSTADEGVAPSPPGTSASAPPPTSTAALPPRSRRGRSANGDVQAECAGGKVRGRCLALRDFYPFWREKLEDATAGKVLPVDLSQSPKVKPLAGRGFGFLGERE